MRLSSLAKAFGRFTKKHSSVILTGVAVGGVITTAFFVARGTMDAFRDVLRVEDIEGRTLNNREIAHLVWPHYVPAVSVATITIGAIVVNQTVNNKRQAALAAAFSLSERTLAEYREQMVERLGQRKANNVMDGVGEQRILENPPTSEQVIATGKGDTLCTEEMSGRYFMSDIEAIRKAVNDLNSLVYSNDYASLNDFYDLLGLSTTVIGSELGWHTQHHLDVHFTSALTPDQVPCLMLQYYKRPIAEYYKGHI